MHQIDEDARHPDRFRELQQLFKVTTFLRIPTIGDCCFHFLLIHLLRSNMLTN